MNPKPVEEARTRELALALPALRRARQRAEEIVIATNTCIVQVQEARAALARIQLRCDRLGELVGVHFARLAHFKYSMCFIEQLVVCWIHRPATFARLGSNDLNHWGHSEELSAALTPETSRWTSGERGLGADD